jgi:hypothetical protein
MRISGNPRESRFCKAYAKIARAARRVFPSIARTARRISIETKLLARHRRLAAQSL